MLGKARAGYTDIAGRAATIREALAARDHALADLLGFSHWVADRTADESQSELISLIESLWERTHLLTANLGRPSEEVDLPSLRRTSLELSEGMKNLCLRFSELAERITSDRQKEDWEASSAFIAVPITEGRGG